jgi:hemolysin activation/secretion protein
MNYYGLGNETKRLTTDNRFNWMRTRNQYASIGLSHRFAKYHTINWNVLYDGIQVLNDENRYVAKTRSTIDPAAFDWQYFLGNRLSYTYTNVNNEAFPTKGIDVTTAAGYTENLQRSGHSFARFTTDLDAYLPLSQTFSIAVRTGAATVTGNPDFYQYSTIGGGRTVRGYRRWRYYGKTAFYNQNELRWVTDVDRGSVYGHFGFLAHYDLGRVWLPGEVSDKLHTGYGAGVIIAPFDKVWVTTVYSFAEEERRFHFTFKKGL